MQVRIVQLGQKKQFKEDTAAEERSEESDQEEEEMVEAVEKGEKKKGLELQQMRNGERREKMRGIIAAAGTKRGEAATTKKGTVVAATKRQNKAEMGEDCVVRGRADWFDGR